MVRPAPQGHVVSGPEHYRQAEILLDRVENFQEVERGPSHADLLAAAQAHATLAVAAATAIPVVEFAPRDSQAQAWLNAIAPEL